MADVFDTSASSTEGLDPKELKKRQVIDAIQKLLSLLASKYDAVSEVRGEPMSSLISIVIILTKANLNEGNHDATVIILRGVLNLINRVSPMLHRDFGWLRLLPDEKAVQAQMVPGDIVNTSLITTDHKIKFNNTIYREVCEHLLRFIQIFFSQENPFKKFDEKCITIVLFGLRCCFENGLE